MSLKPKKNKKYKIKKNRLNSLNFNSKILVNGIYGLKALDYARLTSKQIETAYLALNHILKKRGTVYINIFPDIPITSKSIASRMGKGKGDIKNWVCPIRPGKILFEIGDFYDEKEINYALFCCASKLPIKTKKIQYCKFK
jgi:large subunit ribosomal protein L16